MMLTNFKKPAINRDHSAGGIKVYKINLANMPLPKSNTKKSAIKSAREPCHEGSTDKR